MSTLKQQVHAIVDELENTTADAHDYISEQLDVEHHVDSNGNYIGSDVWITFGGPNVWIDTQMNLVIGRWGREKIELLYSDNIGLDAACCALFG